LIAAAALAYMNALAAGFQFDDFNVIVDNPAVHSLTAWWNGMPGIRPLLKLSYALNWLADPGPAGFHAVNVMLHLVNVALVWRLSAHIPAPGGWEHGPALTRARILVTVLFALHPIQTEAVTYVSGRSMSLMAAFGLAGLLCWLESPGKSRPGSWKALALLLFAAAILTKEVAVVLPLTLILFRHAEARRGHAIVILGLTALALATLFGVLGYQHLLVESPPRGLGANLLSEANAIYYLIGQLFQPHALNIDPALPELTAWSPGSALQVAGIAGILLVAWRLRRAEPWLAFGVFWFVILLLPTHSLIPRLDLASERHLYLAGLGLYWLAAIAVTALLPARGPSWRLVVIGLAVTGMSLIHLRNRDYRDEISLWRQTAQVDPGNARVWNNLGWAYFLAVRKDEARQAYERALRLDPEHEQAKRNLRYLDEVSR
jgi:tetratricopeptide (TPR) repeat protein